MGSKDETQLIRLGGKHLVSLFNFILKYFVITEFHEPLFLKPLSLEG